MRTASNRARTLLLLASLYVGLALVAHATGKPDSASPEASADPTTASPPRAAP